MHFPRLNVLFAQGSLFHSSFSRREGGKQLRCYADEVICRILDYCGDSYLRMFFRFDFISLEGHAKVWVEKRRASPFSCYPGSIMLVSVAESAFHSIRFRSDAAE